MNGSSDTSDSVFTRRFLAGFAVYLVTAAMCYIAAATFITVPTGNTRIVDGVLGFIMGTVMALPLTFFYSTSKTAQTKDATIAAMLPNQPPSTPAVVKVDDTTPVKVTDVPTGEPKS